MRKKIPKGIVCAGNIILDEIIEINRWPEIAELSFIENTKYSPGGSAFNVSCNFKYYNAPFEIFTVGCIGDDYRGKKINEICKLNNISNKNIFVLKKKKTSFTNVLISPNNKERTFFYYAGTNDLFNSSNITNKLLDHKKIKIFHLGYMCLLKGLEKKDKKNKLNLENLFIKIKKRKIDISLDTITLDRHSHYKKFLKCLKYVDHLIINEKEAMLIANNNSNKYNIDNIKKSCIKIASYGVKKNIIIHAKDKVVWYQNKKFFYKKFKLINKNNIVNSSGCGDAFMTGVLWGLNMNYTKTKTIDLAHKFAKNNLYNYCSSPFREN